MLSALTNGLRDLDRRDQVMLRALIFTGAAALSALAGLILGGAMRSWI